jgi:hypothetical protein
MLNRQTGQLLRLTVELLLTILDYQSLPHDSS